MLTRLAPAYGVATMQVRDVIKALHNAGCIMKQAGIKVER
jgi:hypothetical protein